MIIVLALYESAGISSMYKIHTQSFVAYLLDKAVLDPEVLNLKMFLYVFKLLQVVKQAKTRWSTSPAPLE